MTKTGLQYRFAVRVVKADGSGAERRTIMVVALNWAGAWLELGKWAERMLNGSHPRVITSVVPYIPAAPKAKP